MRWPKYWSFSFFSIIPSKEIPGLIHPLKRAVETASINPLIFHQEAPLLDDKSQENENSELGQKKRTRQDHALLKGLGGGFWLAKGRDELQMPSLQGAGGSVCRLGKGV